MIYKYINYDKIINRITNKDKLFVGDYIVDPYQNCEFGCKYCDSSYDNIVYIKNDFLNKIQKELICLSKGTIIIGSVVDPYQIIEKELEMTRNLLKIIKKNHFKVHILTKSDLILRDLDILSDMKNITVTVSIISLDKKISSFFENKVPPTMTRLKLIDKLSNEGIKSGLAIIPILPYIIENEIENIIKESLRYQPKYLLFKFLELKGFQKNIFYDYLKVMNRDLLDKYIHLFKDNYSPDPKYVNKINTQIFKYSKKYGLSNNI